MDTIFDKLTNIANAIRSKTGKIDSLSLDEMAVEINNLPTDIESFVKIIGSKSTPINPSENTIWVNTDVSIPQWVFSSIEPVSPVVGMVWVPTGIKSEMELNLSTTNNSLPIYPMSILQYVSDKWIRPQSMIYVNNAWVEYSNPIYWIKDGIVNEDVGLNVRSDEVYITPEYEYEGSKYVYVFDAYTSTSGPAGLTINPLNLTYYTKITVIYKVEAGGTITLGIYGTSQANNSSTLSSGDGEFIYDISHLTGEQILFFKWNNDDKSGSRLYIKSIIIS